MIFKDILHFAIIFGRKLNEKFYLSIISIFTTPGIFLNFRKGKFQIKSFQTILLGLKIGQGIDLLNSLKKDKIKINAMEIIIFINLQDIYIFIKKFIK